MYFKQIKSVGLILLLSMILGMPISSFAHDDGSDHAHTVLGDGRLEGYAGLGHPGTWQIQLPPWENREFHPIPASPGPASLPSGLTPVQRSGIAKTIAKYQRHINSLLRLIDKQQKAFNEADRKNLQAVMEAIRRANTDMGKVQDALGKYMDGLAQCRGVTCSAGDSGRDSGNRERNNGPKNAKKWCNPIFSDIDDRGVICGGSGSVGTDSGGASTPKSSWCSSDSSEFVGGNNPKNTPSSSGGSQ